MHVWLSTEVEKEAGGHFEHSPVVALRALPAGQTSAASCSERVCRPLTLLLNEICDVLSACNISPHVAASCDSRRTLVPSSR